MLQIREPESLLAVVDARVLQRIEPDALATAAAAVPVSAIAAAAVAAAGGTLALAAGAWRNVMRDACTPVIAG